MRAFHVLLLIAALAGCSGGGGDGPSSSCSYLKGGSACSPIVGTCNNTVAVGDGNLSTSGVFQAASGGYLAAGGDGNFDGGNAGVFLTPPAGLSLTDLTISTYMSSDNSVLESATGPALTMTPTQGDPATDYIGFTATVPFNGVKMTVNSPGLGDFVVYEFCGDATVR